MKSELTRENILVFQSSQDDETLDAICAAALEWLDMEPKPIADAPKDETKILVMWDNRETFWDEHLGKLIHAPNTKPDWVFCFSQYKDTPDRRGFRHRNGANQSTHFIPLSAFPTPKDK